MAYDRRSPQARVSAWSEDEIKGRSISRGWYVLHTSEVGDGATMVEGPDRKVIMPDLQLLDLVKGRKSRFVEVKAKRGAYLYGKSGIWCTGFDLPKWEAYQQIDNSGVPVDVAMIHMHHPYRTSPFAPVLLWQTVKTLAERNPMPNDAPAFPRGGVVWDIGAFDFLGYLPNPPPEIIDAAEAIKCNLRIWEKPPRLRRPRVVPGQLEMFPDA